MTKKFRKPANPYREDYDLFLRYALKAMKVRMDSPEIMMGLLSFALGFERLFKAILHDLNPLYVLKEDSFKNSVSVVYKEEMDLGKKSIKDFENIVAKNPNEDVINFRESLNRCCLFSQEINKHKSMLGRLNQMRDVIAHCPLNQLDAGKCRKMMQGHAFLILEDLSAAKLVDLDALAGERLSTLRRIAINQADDVVKRVSEILKYHKELYESRLSKTPTWVPAMKPENVRPNIADCIWVPCPACGNNAEVETEVDYDYCDHETVPVGVFVSRLYCSFCDLDIEDYEELDHMGITMESITPDRDEY
jgi:hypothetical protein